MIIRLPIIIVDSKEAWEKDILEDEYKIMREKLEDFGVKDHDYKAVPFENDCDRIAQMCFNFDDINLFYQTIIYFNDKEIEGVKVRTHGGYWPPAFAVKFKDFEKLYIRHEQGDFEKYADDVVIDYKSALKIV